MKRLFLSLALALGIFAIPLPSFATVQSTVDKKIYQGDGYSTSFSFPYNVYLATDLAVYETVVATSNTTQLTLNTNYSITLTAISGVTGAYTATINLAGGSSPAGALAVGTQLTILRSLPLTQLINISDYSATPAATWNQAFDRQTILVQQMQEQLNRAILGPITSTNTSYFPGPSPGTIIGWDSSGNLANLVNPSLTAQWSLSAGNIYYNTGNVGIGTSSPYNPLDIKIVTNRHFSVRNYSSQVGINALNDAGNTYEPLYIDGSDLILNNLSGSDVYTNSGGWQDYSATSTIVGFSSISTEFIYYKKVGKTVFVNFYLAGTSNASSITFTLPYSSGSGPTYQVPVFALTNGVQSVGNIVLGPSVLYTTCYPTIAGGTWTNGNSISTGQFWYQST